MMKLYLKVKKNYGKLWFWPDEDYSGDWVTDCDILLFITNQKCFTLDQVKKMKQAKWDIRLKQDESLINLDEVLR